MVDVTGVSKKRLLEVVRKLCNRCGSSLEMVGSGGNCMNFDCPAYSLRFESFQLNAFDSEYKENWFSMLDEVADGFKVSGFYPSQLRDAMERSPAGKNAHSSWIGAGIQRLTRKGWRKTSVHRKSPRRSCNGRHESMFIWDGGCGTEVVG